jgi:outer membrane protein assembly factor BamB
MYDRRDLRRWTVELLLAGLFLFPASAPFAWADSKGANAGWTTYRGNAQRTGNTDGAAGPAQPTVLWTYQVKDHFIAAPVPGDDRLYVSGFGAFNVSTFYCLATDPKAAKRVVWTKSTPYLKLPTVSSPALAGSKLLFGDGMHQTDGAILHCLQTADGLPLWQYPAPGKLVHMEGSPTVAGGRVYIGGGAAGVICVDLERVSLDGKEMGLPAIKKILDARWKVLVAQYEKEKKADPDFAVPPSMDDLPKPAPRKVWQQGELKWHIDAPVTLSGERVLAASAFLDKEQLGDRALFCLDAKTGDIKWRAPLKLNPWGGASVEGNVVVVGGSTIGYDPRELKRAKGEIVALGLEDGLVKWRKSVPGGIVSCVALADGLAIATATDGKVRAFDLATGIRRWIYNGKTSFFAPPAVAGGVVYAGDLKGAVHAINLKDGSMKWVFDLGGAEVSLPGMIYGGPVVHGGKVFVATCNTEGSNAQKPTGIVCLGAK